MCPSKRTDLVGMDHGEKEVLGLRRNFGKGPGKLMRSRKFYIHQEKRDKLIIRLIQHSRRRFLHSHATSNRLKRKVHTRGYGLCIIHELYTNDSYSMLIVGVYH